MSDGGNDDVEMDCLRRTTVDGTSPHFFCADLQEMSTAGYAVSDVLVSVARYAVAAAMPASVKGQLLDKLSDIECVVKRSGAGIGNVLLGIHRVIVLGCVRSSVSFRSPPKCRYRLAFGTSEKLQTASVVAAFHAARAGLHALKERSERR